MSLRSADDRIRLDGPARVEDAEALCSAIQARPDAPVDLSGCTFLHAAVLQVLLVFGPAIEGAADNRDLSDWICPLLDRSKPAQPPSRTGQDH